MPIHVTCSTCGKVLQARDEDAGREAQCANCGNRMTIPQATDYPELPPISGPTPAPSAAPSGFRCSECGNSYGAGEVYNDRGRIICKRCYARAEEYDDRGPPRRRRDEYGDRPDDWDAPRRRPRPRYEDEPYGRPRYDIPTHLAEAILVTIFCCQIFGIVAIVFAAQVNGKIQAGDYRGAQEASATAATWCWVAFGLGLAWSLIVVVIIAAGGFR
jgi:DNA-directed RNA polymerase subunit RPC12/RpoP